MFKAIIRSQLSQLFFTLFGRGSVKKKKNGKYKKTGVGRLILFGILFAYLAIVFIGLSCAASFGAAVFMLDGSAQGIVNYISVFALAALVLCFVGSVFSTEKQLYEAPDNERLLAMPIPSWAILFSRMISLYFINFLFSALVLVPASIFLIIYSHVTAPLILGCILALLLIPLLSLAITAIIGALVAFLASKLPFKTLITTLIFIVFFLGYMVFAMNMDAVMGVIAERGAAVATRIFIFNSLGHFCAGSLLDGLLFACSCLIPFGLVYLILSKSFVSIATANRGERKKKYIAKKMNRGSSLAALTRKELSRFFSMPMYILNSSMGTLFQIIAMVLLIYYKDTLLSMLPEIEKELAALSISFQFENFIPILLCFASTICVSFNCITAPSISLERSRIWQMKAMPVKPGEVLLSKLLCHIIVSTPFTLVFAIVTGVLFALTPVQFLLLAIVPLLINCSSAAWGLCCNLWLPRLDFPADITAIKQSGATILAVFGGMLLYWFPLFIFMSISSAFSSTILFSLFVLFYALITGSIFFAYIFTGGKNKFANKIGIQ
ncbi:MAG: ABC transporter permease [Clostridiales bacterium]|nr:ABC transporter permease [Clostridiales bacterium]